MAATIIDGKAISAQIRAELRPKVHALTEAGFRPGLAVILVGENPASEVYVRNKERTCEKLGILSVKHHLSAKTSLSELRTLIDDLNNDHRIHGILVQLPLPGHLDERDILYSISPEKDVDGFHPYNLGRLMIGDPVYLPCTPWGIQEMLVRSGVEVSGKNVVIFGRSNIVGKPLAMMLVQKSAGANATVTLCHTRTKDPLIYTKNADILVAAVGSPGMVTKEMVKDGAVVVDVGINSVDRRLVGDVDYEQVSQVASLITPVPGGVGPMTIAMLMANTVRSAERTRQKNLVH
ncbi:MAG TPA: bifunctional methylenetetrahydrofolate dehydrogenase/methenyltetrahydrofolate cyclohydrolase FolD [Atribacteraceae bacterium]|nr:bifunctional methylenetetrahydrofolate dehydrogenase/methenyltetrahydrofolate cyclohydrolase FolD [Atribacteraceae bacterium]